MPILRQIAQLGHPVLRQADRAVADPLDPAPALADLPGSPLWAYPSMDFLNPLPSFALPATLALLLSHC